MDSDRLEGLIQVGDEVVDVLDSGRVPDQTLGDAHGLALLERTLDVTRGGGWADDGLDGTEVGRGMGKVQTGNESTHRVEAVFSEHEAQDAPETTHLLFSDRMTIV